MKTVIETFSKWLEILRVLDEPKSMFEIAKKTEMRYQTVLKYCDDLEKLGLIKREYEAGTPPRYIIRLTERGKCLVRCFSQRI